MRSDAAGVYYGRDEEAGTMASPGPIPRTAEETTDGAASGAASGAAFGPSYAEASAAASELTPVPAAQEKAPKK